MLDEADMQRIVAGAEALALRFAAVGSVKQHLNIVDLPQALIDNSPKGEVKLRVNQHFRVQPGSDLRAKLLQVHATAKYIF